jgi:ribosomal protein S18 acetylase RimI-like enzyme
MTEYTLRKASNEDSDLTFEIRKNALGEYVKLTWGWDEEWQQKYHKEDFNPDILKIIDVNGKPAGCLEVIIEPDHILVSGLYIIDKYQNLQIGTRIMSSIIKDASLIPANVKLQVLKVNHKAKAFYERFGFKVYNETEQHFQMIYKFSDK